MAKFDRRYKGEDTHTLDGASWWQGAGILIIVLLGGTIGWTYRKARMLFWWAFRLHFLGQTDQVLKAYGVDNPLKERTHARLTGGCMAVAIGSAILTYYYPDEHLLPMASMVCVVGYIFLTVIYFLNKRDDPVAYAWDVGGDDEW